jgi:hypothetical protein
MSFNPLPRPEINQANRKEDDKKKLLGFWTLSNVQYSEKLGNTMFRKLNMFPSSGEKGGTYSVGFLRES